MGKVLLISELTAQRDAVLKYCDSLNDAERAQPRTNEGWGVQDFVGHLSFWEQFTLNAIRDTFKNGRPTPLAPDAFDDDINGRAAAQRKNWTWQRIRAEFENTRNALIQRIDGLSESDLQFYVPSPWLNDARIITLETMIREDVIGHGQEHIRELDQWQHQHERREQEK
jgi:hypothetical protein